MLAVAVTLRTVSADIVTDTLVVSSVSVERAKILGAETLLLPVVIAAISGDATALLPVAAARMRGLIIAIHLTPFLPLSSSSPLQYP